jgi:hypothetical protein
MKNFSIFKIKYSLKTHILGTFITLLLLTFVMIMGYSYKENTNANTKLGEALIGKIQEGLIDDVNAKFTETQIFSTFGDQSYNDLEQVSPNNPTLVGLMREILRNYPYIGVVYTGTKNGKFLQMKQITSEDSYHTDPDKKLPVGVKFALRFIDLSAASPTETWFYENENRKIIDKEIAAKISFDCRTQE